MKKILIVILSLALLFALSACGGEQSEGKTYTYELAMITASESSSIDDGAFVESTWKGTREFAEENGITYKYYEAEEDTDESRLDQISQAAESGAKVIVCYGTAFEQVVFSAQSKYPDLTFILLDARPKDDEGNVHLEKNTTAVNFAGNQAGYMAGYATVLEGYTKVGFIGESKALAKGYGYGFVQGCNDAAQESGRYVELKYTYLKPDTTAAQLQDKAEEWYADGTQVIFACGGNSCFDSVATEADMARGLVIGCGRDMSSRSENTLTSAAKSCRAAVKAQLADCYTEGYEGGKTATAGVQRDAVYLPYASSMLEAFSREDYRELYSQLKAGEVKVAMSKDADTVSDLIKKKKLGYVNLI